MTIDGAIRANEARTVVRTGQWFPIVDRGEPVFDHPPLFIWSSAVSMKILGVNDVAAQWPSRFFAILTVLATYALARAVGLSSGRALLAALILCLTRDFVLNGSRGYIEPLVSAFSYAAFAAAWIGWGALSGILVFLAFFSKGPPALWPFVFFPLVMLARDRPLATRRILAYFSAFFACCAAFWLWTELRGYGVFWSDYLSKQVWSSAVEGRHGLQPLDPLFFVEAIGKQYWPWLALLVPMLVAWVYSLISRHDGQRTFLQKLLEPRSLIALFGLGFVAGFSLVKWKYWYYIVPAYPAFALFMAASLSQVTGWGGGRWVRFIDEDPRFPRAVAAIAVLWAFLMHALPIPNARIRVPEALQFEPVIRSVPSLRPVWQVRTTSDPNLTGVVEEWYFDRVVLAVRPEEEAPWAETQLKPGDFVISDQGVLEACSTPWCRGLTRLMQSSGRSLFRFEGIK